MRCGAGLSQGLRSHFLLLRRMLPERVLWELLRGVLRGLLRRLWSRLLQVM